MRESKRGSVSGNVFMPLKLQYDTQNPAKNSGVLFLFSFYCVFILFFSIFVILFFLFKFLLYVYIVKTVTRRNPKTIFLR